MDWRTAKTYTPETSELLEATGFLRNAADDTDNDDLNLALIRHRVLELTIQNVTSNVLGLTVACACSATATGTIRFRRSITTG